MLKELEDRYATDEWRFLNTYERYAREAIDTLEDTTASTALELELMCSTIEDGTDAIDGPFIARNWREAQDAITAYNRKSAEYFDDETPTYWKIKLYRLGISPAQEGFVKPAYTYIANSSGTVQYAACGLQEPCHRRGYWLRKAFYGPVGSIRVPVPWKPGDALEIDCTPYVPGPLYCVVKEVSDDGRYVECAYQGECGVEYGSLMSGRYFATNEWVDQYLSPIYNAHVYRGVLPTQLNELETYRRSLLKKRVASCQWCPYDVSNGRMRKAA